MIQDTLIGIVAIIPNTVYYVLNIGRKWDNHDDSPSNNVTRSQAMKSSKPKPSKRSSQDSGSSVPTTKRSNSDSSSRSKRTSMTTHPPPREVSTEFHHYQPSDNHSPKAECPGGIPYIDIK